MVNNFSTISNSSTISNFSVNNFSVIILAAGLGKRMQNPNIPKVLATVNKKPLIYYVLKTAIELNPDRICLVVGHKRELLIDYVNNEFLIEFKEFPSSRIIFAVQEEQLGTGHATACTEQYFTNYQGNILILAGDVPLLTVSTLSSFIQLHNSENSDITVLSALAPNPFGYGRIVRDTENQFTAIVEEKDASKIEKSINEINSGIYFLGSNLLFDLLRMVDNSNSQNEYYLTDIIKFSKSLDKKIIAKDLADIAEVQGINTPEQLQEIEKILNMR